MGTNIVYSFDSTFSRESHDEDPQIVLSSMQNSMWGGVYFSSFLYAICVLNKTCFRNDARGSCGNIGHYFIRSFILLYCYLYCFSLDLVSRIINSFHCTFQLHHNPELLESIYVFMGIHNVDVITN